MDLSQIRELLNLVAASNVAEIEIEEKGVKIIVRKSPASVVVQPPFIPAYPYGPPPAIMPPPVTPSSYEMPPSATRPTEPVGPTGPAESTAKAPETSVNTITVKAPIVGTLYRAPAPDKPPFVQVGDSVSVGDVLCIIEAMKLMNEIESEVSGRIRQILVQSGEPVEYDQPLFVIEPQ